MAKCFCTLVICSSNSLAPVTMSAAFPVNALEMITISSLSFMSLSVRGVAFSDKMESWVNSFIKLEIIFWGAPNFVRRISLQVCFQLSALSYELYCLYPRRSSVRVSIIRILCSEPQAPAWQHPVQRLFYFSRCLGFRYPALSAQPGRFCRDPGRLPG